MAIPHMEISPINSGKRASPVARNELITTMLKVRPGSSSRLTKNSWVAIATMSASSVNSVIRKWPPPNAIGITTTAVTSSPSFKLRNNWR